MLAEEEGDGPFVQASDIFVRGIETHDVPVTDSVASEQVRHGMSFGIENGQGTDVPVSPQPLYELFLVVFL